LYDHGLFIYTFFTSNAETYSSTVGAVRVPPQSMSPDYNHQLK
jgi:hypothetical protein